MVFANLQDKKGTKKKNNTQTKQANAEEKTWQNAKLKMQI